MQFSMYSPKFTLWEQNRLKNTLLTSLAYIRKTFDLLLSKLI